MSIDVVHPRGFQPHQMGPKQLSTWSQGLSTCRKPKSRSWTQKKTREGIWVHARGATPRVLGHQPPPPPRVFFGDHRDTAGYISLGEEQTNNRGELRVALRSLQGHREGYQSQICPDSLVVVNGVLGWAQRWRRHGWQNKSGAVAHVDLWTQILHVVEKPAEAMKWLHVPSHIGIRGNGQADHLADVGRCRSPAFWAHLHPPPPPHQKTRNQTTSRKSPFGGGRRNVSRSQR